MRQNIFNHYFAKLDALRLSLWEHDRTDYRDRNGDTDNRYRYPDARYAFDSGAGLCGRHTAIGSVTECVLSQSRVGHKEMTP